MSAEPLPSEPRMSLVANSQAPSNSGLNSQNDARQVLQQLKTLRHFKGSRSLFWGSFARYSGQLCKASFACILQKNPKAEWLCLAQEASVAFSQEQLDSFWQVALGMTERAVKQGFAFEPLRAALPQMAQPVLLVVNLDMPADESVPALLVLLLDKQQEQSFKEALVRGQLIADIPASLPAAAAAAAPGTSASEPPQPPSDPQSVERLAQVLDLNSILQQQTVFGVAAMTLVNEIADRFDCLRVSLGWVKQDYVEVQAISHLDRLEKKTDACQSLQNAMEECLDQDEELLWPGSLASGAVLQAHEHYSRTQNVAHLFSLPLRVNDKLVGVLLCERNEREFSLDDCRALRLSVDQVQGHVQRLQHQQQWLGLRAQNWLRQQAQNFLGPEHTLMKLGAVAAALLLVFVLFGHWPYKVELVATLETDQVAFISAPFDGHVSDVNVHAGDWVDSNSPLLQIDTRELLLKEAEAQSDVLRYAREAEKARASGDYADMRVAEARQLQAQASLERMQYYLQQSALTAPFKGVVVEGDKERLLGAPVSKGDMLFKIAQIDGLYAKLMVSERDVRELKVGDRGYLKLLSRPENRFELEIVDIIPVAEVKGQEGNVFIVKARFEEQALDWWRPGMSGLAKIEVGDRSILWILTHRLNDFLRMHLWF